MLATSHSFRKHLLVCWSEIPISLHAGCESFRPPDRFVGDRNPRAGRVREGIPAPAVRKHLLAVLVGLIGLTAMTPNAPAQCQFPKLTASDGAANDQFGRSVGLSGDTAVIGALSDDDLGSGSGSAYVFEKVAGVWTQMAKLKAANGAIGDNFGVSVAVSGETAVIGANLDDDRGTDSGSAYVFEKVNGVWTQTAKLTASDGAAKDRFGSSFALNGNTAVIGAWNNGNTGPFISDGHGSAYVFEKIDGVWMQTAKLIADDGAAKDRFGVSVALSGNTTVIGAISDDDLGFHSGSAYVFEKFGGVWMQTVKLAASDGAPGDFFGGSVGLSGDTAVIGASGDDDRGSAYVFEKIGGAWTQTAKLTASDGARLDLFGFSVAVSGDTAVTGAHRDDDACPGDLNCDSGSAYVFALSPPVVDTDGDGILDVCDPCPLDNPDDSDADGVCQSVDACPDTPLGVPINECGCLEAGACCTAGGKCGEFTPDACSDFGGIYQGDGSVCAEGCGFGDSDGDSNVDLVDFAAFQRCFTGPAAVATVSCAAFDVDGCGPIDLGDYTVLLTAFTGP